MRIALVCQSYPPMVSGASFIAEMLAIGLAAKGHDVLVLAASDKRQGYVTRNGCLEIVRLHSIKNPLRAEQRSLLWPLMGIGRHLAKFQPDVVHLHEPLGAGLAGLRSAKALSVPVALTLHQVPRFVSAYLPPLPGLRRVTEAFLWRYGSWFINQCSATVSLSEKIADEVEQRVGVRPFAIGAGIDLGRFNPASPDPNESSLMRQKYGLDMALPILLHVGRLDADKQVEQVIRAVAGVMGREACQLLVVGDGHTRPKLVALSRKLGIGESCHFPGFVTADGDLPGLYRAASLFVTASEIETFGIVVLEAMASGLPVVAPRATCLPELVAYGGNGFLTYPGDKAGMADCMTALLRDREMAEKMGGLGREKAMRFTEERVIDQHEKLYAGLAVVFSELVRPIEVSFRGQSPEFFEFR